MMIINLSVVDVDEHNLILVLKKKQSNVFEPNHFCSVDKKQIHIK